MAVTERRSLQKIFHPYPVFQALSRNIAIELLIGAVVLLDDVSALGLMNPHA